MDRECDFPEGSSNHASRTVVENEIKLVVAKCCSRRWRVRRKGGQTRCKLLEGSVDRGVIKRTAAQSSPKAT
jgi:hypothetical protein